MKITDNGMEATDFGFDYYGVKELLPNSTITKVFVYV